MMLYSHSKIIEYILIFNSIKKSLKLIKTITFSKLKWKIICE